MADTTNILNETTITDPITATLDSSVELSPATEAPGAFVSSVSEAHTETPAESFSKAAEVGASTSEALPPEMEYAFPEEASLPSSAFEKEVRITAPNHDLPVSSEIFFNEEEEEVPEASPASGDTPWHTTIPDVTSPEEEPAMPEDTAEPVIPMSAWKENHGGADTENATDPEEIRFAETGTPEKDFSSETSHFAETDTPEDNFTDTNESFAEDEDGMRIIMDYLKDEGYDHLKISYEEEDMILVKTSRLDKIMEIRFVRGDFSSLSIKSTKVSYSQIVISFIKEAIKFGRLSNIKRVSGSNTVPVE